MRNLLTIALVAVAAILGFFAYQSSQKGNATQADLAAKSEAVTALEAEKVKLTDEMTKLKAEGEAKGLLDKVTALEADKAKLTEMASTMEGERTSLSEKVMALETEKTRLTDQITALTAEKAALTEQAAALQAKVDELTAAGATASP